MTIKRNYVLQYIKRCTDEKYGLMVKEGCQHNSSGREHGPHDTA